MSTCAIDRLNAVSLLLLLCWPIGSQLVKNEKKRDTPAEIVRDPRMKKKEGKRK